MVFSKATLAALALSLFSSANAHMVMDSPTPFGASSLNNSPLDNSGSDFPCKQRPGVYDITKMNDIKVGVPQKLSFTGGATHGGGSCQVSVTLDKNPNKNSQWKVVHSIIGGCPANVGGNLSGDSQDQGSSEFEFSLPQGMPNGEYTLAWTWFNKIGNREMYMNCAPITVSGGSDDNTVFSSLPDMFVANLPRESCRVPDSKNFVFPNPGQSVQTAAADAFATALEGDNCAAITGLGRGSGNAGSPAQPTAQPSAPASSAPTSSAPASSAPATTKAPGEFAPIPSSAVSSAVRPTATSLATVTLTRSAPASSRTSDAPPPANTAPAGSCDVGASPCTVEGMYCFSTTKWGLCQNGCAVERFVSPKTECRNNSIQHVAAAKRDFLRRHAHRRHFQNSI